MYRITFWHIKKQDIHLRCTQQIVHEKKKGVPFKPHYERLKDMHMKKAGYTF